MRSNFCIIVFLITIYTVVICKNTEPTDEPKDVYEVVAKAYHTKIDKLGIVLNNNLNFIGETCQYSVRPTFKGWSLYYEAKFWCPELRSRPFAGTGKELEMLNALGKAQKHFVRQAVDNGILKKEKVSAWLN